MATLGRVEKNLGQKKPFSRYSRNVNSDCQGKEIFLHITMIETNSLLYYLFIPSSLLLEPQFLAENSPLENKDCIFQSPLQLDDYATRLRKNACRCVTYLQGNNFI